MRDPNENKPGYKKTKVGRLPADWQVAPASTFAPFVTSGSRGWADFYSDTGDLFMRITNLRRETPRPDLTDSRYVKLPSNSPEGRRTLLQADDILISITADLGIIGHVSEDLPSPAYISQHLAILRLPAEVEHDRQYLAYSLAGERLAYHFYKVTDQGAKAGLNLDTIRQLPLILPPLPEQEKIAEILSTWDAAIEQTRDLIEAKRQQKKALMQQLLIGKRRLSGFAGEWTTRRLGDVFTERRETNGEDLTLLAITGQRGIIPAADIDRKDASNADKSRYKVIRVGDLGYNTMRMWQGVNAISSLEGIVSPAYTIATPGRCLHGPFLKHYFKFQPVVYQFYRYSQGLVSDTWNLKFHHFAEIVLPFPDLSEQRAIAAVLDTADSEIRSLKDQLTALQQQKKGLMQRLLTGQVRVKV